MPGAGASRGSGATSTSRFAATEDANRWTEAVRESVVKNYNLLDVHI